MKIKTIWEYYPGTFDSEVNKLLAQGWHLAKREVIVCPDKLKDSTFYAELVQLDKPEPDEAAFCDPFDALRSVQEFCDSNKCEGCALYDFCASHLLNNEGPADWKLPEKEASEA